jgi:hypothetical protein
MATIATAVGQIGLKLGLGSKVVSGTIFEFDDIDQMRTAAS